MPRLIVIKGPDQGKQFELVGPMVVGRHSSNPIALNDARISRRHFELQPIPNGYQVVDLGSGNGSRVNGRTVHVCDVRNGDQIGIGETVLLYAADPPSPSSTASLVLTSGSSRLSNVIRSVPADAGSVIFTDPLQAASPWLQSRLANLTVLYEAANAVSHILDVDELLGRIMELVLRTVDADQGCFLVRDPETGELMPRAVRLHSDPTRNAGGKLTISRTIVDHVLTEQKGVLIADAVNDPRFGGGASVARHNLRDVICVPMRGRHETVGVMFLDTHSVEARSPFTDDHLKLAVAVAHQAALAVEETRYYLALINAERLAAVGQTIAGMSHHIKNIMHGVRFGSDMVRTGLAENDRQLLEKGWSLVEKNQTRIDELILDMLSYSKDREPVFEPVEVVPLVEDVLETVRGRAGERGVSIRFEPPVAGLQLVCDPIGVHRALLNLVTNALDAVADVESPTVAVTVESTTESIALIVRDNGPGVPSDRLEDIFKPFVSSKGCAGTGLGLPVSRKIAREHGGDLTAENPPTGGSQFVLRLPVGGNR